MTHKNVQNRLKNAKKVGTNVNMTVMPTVKTQVCFNYSIEVVCDNNRFRWSSRRISCSLPVF